VASQLSHIYDGDSGGPCATPFSSKPSEDVFDDAREDPRTCSDTVQVGGQCWLNGTVNYGTYGIIVRLCSGAFLFKFALALTMAETLIDRNASALARATAMH
jgi:hypothetical protein